MRNICHYRYFCDLEVLWEVLQPFGNTLPVAVLRNSFATVLCSFLLLRVFAGSTEIDRSCGGDVEEEVVVELDDSPGTTKGTNFSVLQKVCFPFLVRRGSLPLGHNRVLCKACEGTTRQECLPATAH